MRISLDEPEKKIDVTEDMIEREAIKKTWAGEKKKLSEMTTSQKISYIWGYYKIPIIASLVGILAISYAIFLIATKKDSTILGIVVNNPGVESKTYCEYLADYIGLDNKHKVDLVADINLMNGGNVNVTGGGNYSGTTQILCFITAGELDYSITDEYGYNYLVSQEVCVDLKEFLPEKIYNAFEDKITVLSDSDINYPTAINLTGSRLAKCMRLTSESVYLTIQNRSGHAAEMNKFLEFLYEFEQPDSSLSF